MSGTRKQKAVKGEWDHHITRLGLHGVRDAVGNEVELEARGAPWDRATLGDTLRFMESQVSKDLKFSVILAELVTKFSSFNQCT